MANEFSKLKVSELMLYFYRFKAGYYGRFYGIVDPMIITTSIQLFLDWRNSMLANISERKKKEQIELDDAGRHPITYEEYLLQKKAKE